MKDFLNSLKCLSCRKATFAAIILIVILFAGQSFFSGQQSYSLYRLGLGTFIRITICAPHADSAKVQKALSDAWTRIEEIENLMSLFRPESDISKINQSYPNPIEVHQETYDLLKESYGFFVRTQKTFDITVGALEDQWTKAQEENRLLSAQEKEEAQKKIGFDKVRFLPPRAIQILAQGVKLDLGGVAKGYAVDEAAKVLEAQGFSNFLIDAGGDVLVHGRNCKNENWTLGVRDPRQKERIVKKIHLAKGAAVTSGDYEQYYTVQDKHYSHILNPLTGMAANDVVSATVIGPSAREADAYATALCVLGGEKGLETIASLGEGFAAIIFELKGGELVEYQSKNFSKWTL